jgi:transaldolase
MNRVRLLPALGQSVWLDYIRRDFLVRGELRALIEQDNLSGVTTNPSIFDEAIAAGEDYDAALRLCAAQGESALRSFHRLAIDDVRQAADELIQVYRRFSGRDGFVSLEVSPGLAHDTDATLDEARRLWLALDRPNVMIKIPATDAGLSAITRLVADGINVNVTLIFGLRRYQAVAHAYIAGLELRRAAGRPVDHIASVASFFLSRIDLLAEKHLDDLVEASPALAPRADALRGRLAIACAKQAYSIYQDIFGASPFLHLAGEGAGPQSLLWASTGTKTPGERDTRYVEALIGPGTVTTLPRKTLDAFRERGEAAPTLTDDVPAARLLLAEAGALGLDLDALAARLETEGLEKFARPFDHMLDAIRTKLKIFCP